MGTQGVSLSLLLLVLLLSWGAQRSSAQVLGDVTIYLDNYTLDTFPDLPADFGPDIPEEGVDGLLVLAEPEDGCGPLRLNSTPDEPWVALISRAQQLHPTNCTFDVKVRNAELAGASAAIVYDDSFEALIIMSKPRDNPEPAIPAVFVSEKAGIIMRKLITPGATRVRIVAVSASAWMSLVMSAFLGLMALSVVLATFYVMRSWSLWLSRAQGRRGGGLGDNGPGGQGGGQQGLPECAINALPVLVYEGKASRRRRSFQAALLQPASLTQPPRGTDAATDEASGTSAAAAVAAAAAAAWMSADTAGGAASGSSRSSLQGPAAAAAAAAGDSTAAVAVPGRPEQQLLPHVGPRFWQQQQGVAAPLLLRMSALAGGGSSSLPARLLPSVGASGTLAAGPALLCRSPHSDLSSPLLSTDDEEEEEEEEADQGEAAAAAAAEPVLASSSGSGQHCIITAGPVGARGGATRRTCVVCLERYRTGDTVRVLPCQHRFHSSCIDLWLASRRLCPVCKHDASSLPPAQLLQQQQQQHAAAAAGAAQPAAAAAAALGAGSNSPSAAGGAAGLLFLGQRYFAHMRSRLSRAGQDQQQAATRGASSSSSAGSAGAALAAAMGPGAGVNAAAAAAAGAAPAAADAASARDRQQQHLQWQQQHSRTSASSRPLLWLQQQRQQQGLREPLLPAAAASAAAPGALPQAAAGSSGSSGGSRAALWAVPASAAVPIPPQQLTQADAGSSAHGMV